MVRDDSHTLHRQKGPPRSLKLALSPRAAEGFVGDLARISHATFPMLSQEYVKDHCKEKETFLQE